MGKENTEALGGSGKGDAFFDRADKVAATGNWDYAINLYVDGIRRDPANLARGYKPLREVSLSRKAQGGKGPSMVEKLKLRSGKKPVDALANALQLLAKEPGSSEYMESVLKAATKLQLKSVAKWAADRLLETQRVTEKPSKRILVAITEVYRDLKEYELAVQAGILAQQADPDDGAISDLLRDVSAKLTIAKGGYEEKDRDFTRAVKDMDKQTELTRKDAMVKDKAFLEKQIEKAREEYLSAKTTPGKINAYADALLQFEDAQHEDQAAAVLNDAFEATGAYQFKMRIGDVRIRQMTRKWRQAKQEGNEQAAMQIARDQLAFELAEYKERAVNYPTDLSLKYELGRRQFLAGQYDEAIVTLQAAQHDPRRRRRAMSLLGQAFHKKDMLHEAIETYERALEGDVPEKYAKEVGYSLADALEKLGETSRAAEEFSKVAQLDYQYKDTRQRLEGLRRRLSEEESPPRGA